jgi:hypothetical protein
MEMTRNPDEPHACGEAPATDPDLHGIPGILDADTLAHLLQVELARARRYEHPFTLLRLKMREGVGADNARRAAGALRLHTRWADSMGIATDGSLLVILRDTSEGGADAVVTKIAEFLREELSAPGPDIFELSSAAWRKGDDLARLMNRLG